MADQADPGTDEYAMAELMSVGLARSMAGEQELVAYGGANQNVQLAAARLAQLTVAPNMWLMAGGAGAFNGKFDHLPVGTWDPRCKHRAEARAPLLDVVDEGTSGHVSERLRYDGVSFGGMQVDKYGNTNMIGIGSHPELDVRGPGTVGTIWIGAGPCNIVLEHHNDRIFVEEVDHRSGAGWLDGGDSRSELLDGREGPQLVWTPLCVCDFTEDEHRMRLRSVHPGYTVDDVTANTGFDLVVPDDVPTTTPPTEWELQTLRSRVDRGGTLKETRLTIG